MNMFNGFTNRNSSTISNLKFKFVEAEDFSTDNLEFKVDLPIKRAEFIKIVARLILTDIFIETFNRTEFDQKEKYYHFFYPEIIMTGNPIGLIDIYVDCILQYKELFIKYDKELDIIRFAEPKEIDWIRKRLLSFKPIEPFIAIDPKRLRFDIGKLLFLCADILYNIISTENTQTYVSKSIIYALNMLTERVAAADAAVIKNQLKAMDSALSSGKPIAIDSKSQVIFPSPDTSASTVAFDNLISILAFFTRMTKAWLVGDSKSGSFNAGESDSSSVERGLRIYFTYFLKPFIDSIFKVNCRFVPDYYKLMVKRSGNELLENIENSVYLTGLEKQQIIRDLFNQPYMAKFALSKDEMNEVIQEMLIKKNGLSPTVSNNNSKQTFDKNSEEKN